MKTSDADVDFKMAFPLSDSLGHVRCRCNLVRHS